jgi:hypothetical protein
MAVLQVTPLVRVVHMVHVLWAQDPMALPPLEADLVAQLDAMVRHEDLLLEVKHHVVEADQRVLPPVAISVQPSSNLLKR